MNACRAGIIASTLALMMSMIACSNSRSDENSKSASTEPAKKAAALGVDPRDFKCEAVISNEDLAGILGGQVERMETPFEPAPGTPAPCHYAVTRDGGQDAWSFDLDCRPSAIDTAKKLIVQYQSTSGDAGADVVQIGRGGLDHHGQALLFMDDDSPCYVRVQGRNAEQRQALATRIAAYLTEETAPVEAIYRRRQ